MKKSFFFILLLFSIIFFSSCHDDGLSGIIDKSVLQKDDNVASTETDPDKKEGEKISRLEELMRREPNIRKVIEILNRSI
ncbi:hypothetical protein [Blattabacterium sp. (Nauphoeta cinerea)]|uniref:hypothetical protein n=1 Tax=Blattabacterium sp. (Nauphoeta cinerea) TaxID=1316444 RepID=UPI0006880851|nr:hypothetical protein [Blattabacterium sp. (Nauphoeta cinerea)]